MSIIVFHYSSADSLSLSIRSCTSLLNSFYQLTIKSALYNVLPIVSLFNTHVKTPCPIVSDWLSFYLQMIISLGRD